MTTLPRPSSPIGRTVAIVHTDDPDEAIDFCRGVAACVPSSGPWRLRSVPFRATGNAKFIRKVIASDVDGVIMMPGRAAVLRPLHKAGIGIVDVDDTLPGEPRLPFPQVRLDHAHVGRLATRHLIDRGFERLLFIGVREPWSTARASAFAETAVAAGVTHTLSIAPDYATLRSSRWLVRQLNSVPQPIGVFAVNDDIGSRLIDVAESQGWSVPHRLGVIGVDDRITECIRVLPPLSSISNERFQAGYEAAKLLDRGFIRPTKNPPIYWLRPHRVVERESTSVSACGDPELAAAMTFIREHACAGATVDDVVHHVNLSRSTLVRRFQQRLGRSPGDELRRTRLAAIKQLLEHGGTPLGQIAKATGFASMSSLSHCFRTVTGMSPDEYRRSFRGDGPR